MYGAAQLIDEGCLRFIDTHSGATRTFGDTASALHATLRVTPTFFHRVALKGDLGAGEAYVVGDLDTDDVASLARIVLRNRRCFDALDGGIARAWQLAGGIIATLDRNTLNGSRRNIAAHYDTGNDFFDLILDETMSYSCPIYPRGTASLAEASRHKLARVCEHLALTPRDHLLDIGGGWVRSRSTPRSNTAVASP